MLADILVNGTKLPARNGNYNIIYLDDEYQYAVIDGGSKEYLWILSRKATIDDKTLKILLEKIKQNGLDSNTLIYTKHHD